MKPLLAILSGTSLALAAAADPTLSGRLLNVVVPMAWAQQDRGRDDDREDRDENRREERDRHRSEDKDRDDDKDRDEHDDRDRGGQDEDRGGGHGDDDRGRGNGDEHHGDEHRGGGGDDGDGGDDGGPDLPQDGGGGHGDGDGGSNSGDAGTIDLEVPDRGAESAERGFDHERDRDLGELASRFDLDDTETFDDDGFLARRGEIIALSTHPELDRRAAALGLQVAARQSVPSLRSTVYRLRVPPASSIDGILARLRADDPDGVFDRNHLYDGSADRVRSIATSATPARALVSTATGLSVGLIDTGVDVLHPALRGTHIEMRFFVDEPHVLTEAHGTAVASLLVSPETGALPGAQLYVAGVFYEDRRGGLLSEAEDLVRALDWLIERRAPVINMSLSGPPNEVLRAAVARALAAGHLIVAAVGNAGPASPPLYPAAYEGVMAVTAVDSERHVYRRASRGAHVEFAAVGVDVVAAAPDGLAVYSGTSFASPYVAALAAIEHRSLDRQQADAVRERLRGNAMDLGKPGRDEVYGFGLAQPGTISTAAAR